MSGAILPAPCPMEGTDCPDYCPKCGRALNTGCPLDEAAALGGAGPAGGAAEAMREAAANLCDGAGRVDNDPAGSAYVAQALARAIRALPPPAASAPAEAGERAKRIVQEWHASLGPDDMWNARASVERLQALIAVALPAPAEAGEMSAACRDVLAERRRQVDVGGWSAEHDDAHADRSLASAAATYVLGTITECEADRAVMEQFGTADATPHYVLEHWPQSWDRRWFKPATRRRDLVKAAALLIAEIERLDRAAPPDHHTAPERRAG